MYENSDSFRNYVNLERYGISPTLTFAAERTTRRSRSATSISATIASPTAAFRRFRAGRLMSTSSTFFGNPDDSHVRARVNLGSATIEHQAGRAEHSQPHDCSAITIAATRISCPAR